MYLNELMKERHMTRAELCEKSGIPESTLRDILSGKTQIDHCEAGTLYCLAEALDTTVEDIIDAYWDEDQDENEPERIVLQDHTSMTDFYKVVELTKRALFFENGMEFVKYICDKNYIETCYTCGHYKVALFLLGMIDHLCKEHNCPLDPRFDKYRSSVLDLPVTPRRMLGLIFTPHEFLEALDDLNERAIPELARFNIFMTAEDIALRLQ